MIKIALACWLIYAIYGDLKYRFEKIYDHFLEKIKPTPYYEKFLLAQEQLQFEKQLYALAFIPFLWLFQFAVLILGISPIGIIARDPLGLLGIFTSVLFHGSLDHLYYNSLGLLLFLPIFIFLRRNNILLCLILMTAINGFFVWIFSRPGEVIGASGLIYALWGYIICSGILTKDKAKILLGIALLIPTSYMFKGMSPLHVSWRISFEAHFFGALAGLAVAYICVHRENYAWIEIEPEIPLTDIKK